MRGQLAAGRGVQPGAGLRRLSRCSQSIVSYGLAVGAVYALIGITYNVMFSASRVFSFTAGMLGMLGGVLGALFITRSACPSSSASSLVLACGAVIGVVTEIVAVRPVLKSLEQHLYVLSTLAFALMVQQFAAIEWGTERAALPAPDPDRPGLARPAILAADAGLRRRRSSGSNCSIAAPWSAAPSSRSRRTTTPPARSACRSAAAHGSFALAGIIGGLAGFTGGEMLLAFFGNAAMLNFYGFVPVALGGMGNNRGAVIGGLALGLFQQAANFLVGGIFARSRCSRSSSSSCCCGPRAGRRSPARRV